jgi:hypothetical protein
MASYSKALKSKWGRIVVELAELNALAEGPIDDLKHALVDLRNDAKRELAWTEKHHG